MRQSRHNLFDMSYLEVFRVLTVESELVSKQEQSQILKNVTLLISSFGLYQCTLRVAIKK